MAPAHLLGLSTYLLSITGKRARGALAVQLATRDLSLADMAVLAALDELGPAAQRSLADGLRIDAADMARLLDRLDQRGLVERRRDGEDRRRLLASLTRKGRAALRACLDDAAAVQAAMLEPLTRVEQRQLHDLLSRVHAHGIEQG